MVIKAPTSKPSSFGQPLSFLKTKLFSSSITVPAASAKNSPRLSLDLTSLPPPLREIPEEQVFKLSTINDSGVYLPPSPSDGPANAEHWHHNSFMLDDEPYFPPPERLTTRHSLSDFTFHTPSHVAQPSSKEKDIRRVSTSSIGIHTWKRDGRQHPWDASNPASKHGSGRNNFQTSASTKDAFNMNNDILSQADVSSYPSSPSQVDPLEHESTNNSDQNPHPLGETGMQPILPKKPEHALTFVPRFKPTAVLA